MDINKQVVFTYKELITAFEIWFNLLENGEIPNRPDGEHIGIMATNYLIDLVNQQRRKLLTEYNK